MINDFILLTFMFFGVFGALIVVTTNNHVNLCLGYLILIIGLSGVIFTLNSLNISIILLLLHTITIVIIITFGIFACGFKVIINNNKDRLISLIAFFSGILLFLVLTMALLKNNFSIINNISYSQTIGYLFTQKYVVLFEIIAITMLIAITGTVFVLKRRE